MSRKLETRHGLFRKTHEIQGEVRFADLEKMRQAAPKIWEKAVSQTPGMIMRRDGEWDWRYNPQRVKNIQRRKPFFVIYSENSDPLGYAEYSVEERHRDMHSVNLVRVRELIPATTTAEIALWRYILDIDLASEIYHEQHPKKSNLLWLLADPAQAFTRTLRLHVDPHLGPAQSVGCQDLLRARRNRDRAD